MGQIAGAQHVLVTGAGSGIGQAVAEYLATAGYRVIGTVRNADRARTLTAQAQAAGQTLDFRPLDLAVPSEVAALATELTSAGGVDILIHNAGFGVFGPIEQVDAASTVAQFATNLFGPLQLTRALLPTLRARRGQIIWVGSLAGRISLPFQAHYSATKAAVASISDALRMELKSHGVRVTCVEPGDFATGFTNARRVVGTNDSPYRTEQDGCLRAVERQERGGPGPAVIALAVERLCRVSSPPARLPIGRGARVMCLLVRLLPDRLRELAVRRNYDL
jgi:short-subunit dehydrogenase